MKITEDMVLDFCVNGYNSENFEELDKVLELVGCSSSYSNRDNTNYHNHISATYRERGGDPEVEWIVIGEERFEEGVKDPHWVYDCTCYEQLAIE